ncbi:MAG: tripartite tricarboxylate transporter TctB family protein [Firmicutes bacterium]|nr:tripartite tricarboxylate transporter TctB family protein [Bacillota bacterium]
MNVDNKKEIGIGVFCLILSAMVLFWSRNFRKDDTIYIYCIVGLLALLGVIRLVSTIVSARKAAAQKSEEAIEPPAKAPFLTRKQIMVCVLFALYVIGLYVFGFVISSVIFMVLIPILMNYRKPIVIVISTLIICAVIYGIFFGYLKLPRLSGLFF